jgi:hypothetical protein
MQRVLLAALLLPVLLLPVLWAANIRLYLKDGSHHIVREYQQVGDRVKYFSFERSEWEEIPLELVDLKRTRQDIADREASRKEEAAATDAEEKAEREMRREIERVPVNPGVYFLSGEELKAVPQAESKVVGNKRRSILKAMSPIPIVAGKATVELDGLASAFTIRGDRPEFYIRLAAEERFGIARMKPAKASRIVQTWSIIPVTKEIVEEMDAVEVFRQQVAEGLYKIWPTKPIAPGEYAVIEYTEGKGNLQVWDFRLEK